MEQLLKFKWCSTVLLLIIFSASQNWIVRARPQNCAKPVSCDEGTDYFSKKEKIAIEYAIETIRDVAFSNTYVDFTGRGLSEDEFYKYRIVVCGCPLPKNSNDRIVLYTNPKSLYVNESPSLALLHFLQPTIESLSYINTAAYIYTPAIREKVAKKETKEIIDSNFVTDYSILEKDDSLSGSLIGTFTVSDYLKNAKDVPFIVVAESSETSPLARAEWMKIVGLYLGLSEKANDRFADVVREYESAKGKAFDASRRPSVLLNYPVAMGPIDLSKKPDDNYNWFLPYHDQYTTDLINDANADYRYANVDSEMSLQKKMSEVVKDFGSARFFLLAGTFPADSKRDTLEEFMDAVVSPAQPDSKAQQEFQKLSSVRCGKVWGREKRISEDGMANDYFESGVFQPDEILKDLVSILHPNVDFGKRDAYYMHFYKPESSKYTSNCPYNDFVSKPVSGEKYIDTFFGVPGLDRFEIEDLWETKIDPELKKLKLPATFDIMFREVDSTSTGSLFTLRAKVEDGTQNNLGDPEGLRTALQNSLGTTVNFADFEETSQEGGKRGFSRLAIAAIVLVLLLFVVLAVLYIRRKRQRNNLSKGPIERIPGAKQERWAELEETNIGPQMA